MGKPKSGGCQNYFSGHSVGGFRTRLHIVHLTGKESLFAPSCRSTVIYILLRIFMAAF
jgi:hypothetical protein